MKNYLSIVILLFLGLSLNAQAPQGFNYQATVRNASGDLMVNQNVFFKFNIIQGTQTAIPTYTEQHYVPTDDLGQVSIVIGQGTPTTGVFSELDWSQGSFYLGIELDTGNGYVAMGTTQLLSVPYALYAENSGNAETSTPSLESVLEVNNSANDQKITNLLNPTSDQDAATKYYVDDEINNSSQTLEQVLSNGNNASGLQIKGLANPTDPQDAVNLEVLNNQINFLQNQLTDIYQNLVDGDGDGFTPGAGDCDDSNPLVYPDAIEICDGIDNNCDGIIDGNPETEYFADIDGDGYGNSMSSVLACSQPIGYVTDNTDCDDANALVFPGADEICDNIDNNCNNLTDEGITPTVVSVTGNPLTTNSIYVEAQLYDDCISQISSYGFVYSSTEQIPSLNTGSIEEVGQEYQYEFNAQISGLLPSTNYYVRAYATNEFGTSYGDVIIVGTEVGEYLIITSPTENELINPGANYPIEWESNYSTNERLIIEHYIDGQMISELTNNAFINQSQYQWQIPIDMPASSNNQLKVFLYDSLQELSTSSNFQINNSFNLTSPQMGDEFCQDDVIISWDLNYSTTLMFELYAGSSNLGVIGQNYSSDNLEFIWDAFSSNINVSINTNYRIKVTDQENEFSVISDEFSTTGCLPILTTITPTDITFTSATSGGDITDEGGAIMEMGLVWGTTNNPTITSNLGITYESDTNDPELGTYYSNLTSLNHNTVYHVRAYATNSFGTSYGQEETFSTSQILNVAGPNLTDIDGNTYETVQIGNQIWTKQNLNVSKYRNGVDIPQITDYDEWHNTYNTQVGAWCYYSNNSSNGTTYGKLYNWYAVSSPNGLAPDGYHIPSAEEWDTLINYLGGSSIAGEKMKNWDGASNISGFTGLPGGERVNNGLFYVLGEFGFWWSTDVINPNTAYEQAKKYYLRSGYDDVPGMYGTPRWGHSVRLIKDE